MSVDGTAEALMAMEDEELRNAVAEGRAGALDPFDLDDHERNLVELAAGGGDDTTGFATFAPPYIPMAADPGLVRAIRYVEDGQTSPATARGFEPFARRVGGRGSW